VVGPVVREFLEWLGHRLREAGDEEWTAARDERTGDSQQLRKCLTRRQDDFWEALAKSAVMIDLGVTELLERQIAQPLHRIGDRQLAATDTRQQRL
jgi:hypothetical protein